MFPRMSQSVYRVQPTFRAAGAGATHATTQNILLIGMPAGITDGDALFLHMFSRTPAILPTTLSGWDLVSNVTFLDGRHQVVFCRVVDGTESTQTVILAGAPNVAIGRSYAWRGVALSGPTTFTIHNSSTGTAGNDSQFSLPTIVTSTANNVAVFLACFDESLAISAPTGESGGDWVEPVAEYTTLTGSNATIFALTADLASATTLSGGTAGPGGGSDDGAFQAFTLHGSSGVPTFVTAGTAAENGVTATVTAAVPAGVVAGDILVAQFGARSHNPTLPTAIAGWELMGLDLSGSANREQGIFARVATGSDANLVIALSGTIDVCVGRMYAFKDCAGIAEIEDSATSTGATLTGPTLGPTDYPAELGVSFVYIDDDEAIDAYSGPSGGTWTEAVAEYSTATGNDAGIQCQIATLAAQGTTISGGTINPSGDTLINRSWAFRGRLAA